MKSITILLLVFALGLFGCTSQPNNEQPENENIQEETSKIYTVDEAYEQSAELDGQVVTIQGNLPQAMISDEEGEMIAVIWNQDQSQYVILEGETVTIGGCEAELTGKLSVQGEKLILEVSSFTQL